MSVSNLQLQALRFVCCFFLSALSFGALIAQIQNDDNFYYWSDLGKTELEVDNNSYILLAKNNSIFESKLKSNINNQHIKKASKTGFFVYENSNAKISKKDILKDLSLDKENWEIHPALKTSAGTAPFYPTRKVLFKMNNGEAVSTIDNILDNYSLVSIKEVRPDVYTAEVSSIAEAMKLSNEIYESGHAKFSQPNFTVDITVNNDPFFDQQFQMHNTGQRVNGRTSTADIDADALEAWGITTGSSSIRVAVFDRGLEAHPDLTDANGNSTIVGGFSPDVPGGNGAPDTDPGFHGMACAGIINAAHNNIGVRGIAPGVRLLGVNIFTAETTESLASSFTWAMNNGADVISNSWSFTDADCSTDHPALNDAIEDAFRNGRNGRGCLIVFSTGNQGENGCVAYPARLNTVTAVGAITSRGIVPSYGQTGPALDLVAPTSDAVSATANVHTIDRVGNFGLVAGDYLSFFGGTSAAAPLVAGTAALVYSVNPDLTVAQMRNILYNTADDMGPSGRDNNFGHGRVNAHQAVLAAGGSTPPPTTNNIALNKPATQSSTRFNGVASRAVDGNTNGNSFTHSDFEQGWWRVDLLDQYDINRINIFNRTTCCSDRLVGASVYVGNIGSSNPNDYTLVGALNSNAQINFTNLNVRGRYVLIDRNNTNWLSLAEVQVFGTLAASETNVALNKPATQSSTRFNGVASRAVDGNTSGNSFTHSDFEQGWWRVDLLDQYDISTINVFNRTSCCSDRLVGARVYVGNIGSSNPNDYILVGSLNSNAQINFTNLNVRGRYVLIDRSNTNWLSLSEVQVFGTVAAPEANVALNKPSTQSSIRFGGAASRAVDGNTSGNSFTHTDFEQGWWRVDLLDEYSISTINVFNRTTCCSDRLVGASVYVGNIRSTNPNDYTLVGSLNSNARINFTNLNVSGRYVLIDRNNTNWLSLAEVQVFGTIAPSLNSTFNITSNEEVAIFPNPAIEGLHIDLSKYQNARTTYSIIDYNGIVRMKGQFNENHLDQEYIELEGLLNGNYILYLNSEGNKPTAQKFIVLKP